MCPSAPSVCSEPGGQRPVLSLSLDLIVVVTSESEFCCCSQFTVPDPWSMNLHVIGKKITQTQHVCSLVIFQCYIIQQIRYKFGLGMRQTIFKNASPPSAAYMCQWTGNGSGIGSAPAQRQAITWIKAGLLAIGLLGTNFSEIRIGILSFSLKKLHVNMSSAKMAAISSRGRWVNKWVLQQCSTIPTISTK